MVLELLRSFTEGFILNLYLYFSLPFLYIRTILGDLSLVLPFFISSKRIRRVESYFLFVSHPVSLLLRPDPVSFLLYVLRSPCCVIRRDLRVFRETFLSSLRVSETTRWSRVVVGTSGVR